MFAVVMPYASVALNLLRETVIEGVATNTRGASIQNKCAVYRHNGEKKQNKHMTDDVISSVSSCMLASSSPSARHLFTSPVFFV